MDVNLKNIDVKSNSKDSSKERRFIKRTPLIKRKIQWVTLDGSPIEKAIEKILSDQNHYMDAMRTSLLIPSKIF
jgi:hypothetical protein